MPSARPRGPRTRGFLSRRERPGEVVVATGLLGCAALPFVLAGVFLLRGVVSGFLPPQALLLPLQGAILVFSAGGLWRGARWAWMFAMLVLGMAALGAFVGTARYAVRGSEGLPTAVCLAIVGALCGAPMILLWKARRRYEEFARSRGTPGSGQGEPL